MKRIMIFCLLISLFIVSSLILSPNSDGSNFAEISSITWNFDYEGPIYSHIVDYNQEMEYAKVGYSDGNGNYYLEKLNILDNESLKIEEGISVFFIDRTANQFNIYGSIEAIGTPSRPITFTSNDSEPEPGSWNGFNVLGKGDGKVLFENCNFMYSAYNQINRDVIIRNCTFHSTYGIKPSGKYEDSITDKIMIEYCSFEGKYSNDDRDMGEIHLLSRSDIILKNCYFDVEYFRVVAYSEKRVIFNDNIVADCSYISLGNQIIHVSGSMSRNDISNCTIYPNSLNTNHNSFIGDVEIDLDTPPSYFTYNEVIGDFTFRGEGTESQEIDLRLNYWGVDWDVEDRIGIAEWSDDVDIIYEPYLDGNGTETDNDGIPNSWEHEYGLDIYTDDPNRDSDDDGLTNLKEYEIGTNPKKIDTDDDGWNDGEEVSKKTDPLNRMIHPGDDVKENDSKVLIIVIIVGLIAVLLVLLFIIIKRRKSGESEEYYYDESTMNESK